MYTRREHGVEYTAPKDALVTPEAIKEMCKYIYTEPHLIEMCENTKPHLISVAKSALEANSQRASKKQRCFSPPRSLLQCQEECVRTRAGAASGPAGYAACLRRCAKKAPQWDRILNRNSHSGCTPGIVVEAGGVQRLSHDEDERKGESLAEIIEDEAERVRVRDLIEQVTLTHIEENMEGEGETHSHCGSMECPPIPMSDALADKEGMEEEERDKEEQEREQEQELGRARATKTRETMSQRSPQGDRAIKEATGVSRLPPNAFSMTNSATRATPGPPSLSKAEALEGYTCRVSGATCETVCGDGLRVGSENCDDGNSADGDGCSSTCEVEAEWICSRARSDTNGRVLGEEGPSTCARLVVVTMSHRSPQEDQVIKALLEGAEDHEDRAIRERERVKPLHEGAD